MNSGLSLGIISRKPSKQSASMSVKLHPLWLRLIRFSYAQQIMLKGGKHFCNSIASWHVLIARWTQSAGLSEKDPWCYSRLANGASGERISEEQGTPQASSRSTAGRVLTTCGLSARSNLISEQSSWVTLNGHRHKDGDGRFGVITVLGDDTTEEARKGSDVL